MRSVPVHSGAFRSIPVSVIIRTDNCKLYYIYLMIVSEIQSEIGHCSCDGAKFKAPADFSHHAILLYDIVLNIINKHFTNPPICFTCPTTLPCLAEYICNCNQ